MNFRLTRQVLSGPPRSDRPIRNSPNSHRCPRRQPDLAAPLAGFLSISGASQVPIAGLAIPVQGSDSRFLDSASAILMPVPRVRNVGTQGRHQLRRVGGPSTVTQRGGQSTKMKGDIRRGRKRHCTPARRERITGKCRCPAPETRLAKPTGGRGRKRCGMGHLRLSLDEGSCVPLPLLQSGAVLAGVAKFGWRLI